MPVQPVFTPPTVFDNVFWDNRAGSYDGGFVRGIGLPGDSAAVNHWDLGAYGVAPANALKPGQERHPGPDGPHQLHDRGNVASIRGCSRRTTRPSGWRTFRGDPHFVGGTIVAVDVPPTRMGNYKLSATSPAAPPG